MAWIEIADSDVGYLWNGHVALLTEGVDRNNGIDYDARDAAGVAFLAEGADRNYRIDHEILLKISRPPHGGRG